MDTTGAGDSTQQKRSPSGRSTSTGRATTTRGATACAECRRLKIRCVGGWPCDSCVRRKCSSICPTGALQTTYNAKLQRTGQVLDSVDALNQKLSSYKQWIRELELALAQESQLHPLLNIELVRMTDDTPEEHEEEVVEAFGTLELGEDGKSRWTGPQAISSWILRSKLSGSFLNNDIAHITNRYPGVPEPDSSVSSRFPLHQLLGYLPAKGMLDAMINSYYDYATSVFLPIPRPLLQSRFLSVPPETLKCSQISVLFAILALTCQSTPNPPQEWPSGGVFYSASQAALGEDVWDNPDINTVASLGLQSLWLERAGTQSSPEAAWGRRGEALKIAQALGLHRDPKYWCFDEEEVRKRRRLFYELWSLDIYSSAINGRPPSLTWEHVDCEMPFDTLETIGTDPTFHRWKHQYWCGILLEILNSAVAPHVPPTYATIMSLDKKLHLQPTPDKFLGSRQPCVPVDIRSYSHPSIRWQEQIVYSIRIHARMMLHRPFFALSLLESGTDLSRAKYAKSVSAVYDGAKAILSQLVWLREHELGTLRMMQMWPYYAMLCLVVLGGIAAKAPRSTYGKQSFEAFELGCKLMLDGDGTNNTCHERTCPPLLQIWDAAHAAMARAFGSNFSGDRDLRSRLAVPLDSSQMPTPRITPVSLSATLRASSSGSRVPSGSSYGHSSQSRPVPSHSAMFIPNTQQQQQQTPFPPSPPLQDESPFQRAMAGLATRSPPVNFNDYLKLHHKTAAPSPFNPVNVSVYASASTSTSASTSASAHGVGVTPNPPASVYPAPVQQQQRRYHARSWSDTTSGRRPTGSGSGTTPTSRRDDSAGNHWPYPASFPRSGSPRDREERDSPGGQAAAVHGSYPQAQQSYGPPQQPEDRGTPPTTHSHGHPTWEQIARALGLPI